MKNKFKFGGLLALLGVLGLASGTASATPIDYWFTNTGSIDVGTCTDASYCKTLTTQGDFKVGNEVLGTFQSTLTVLKFFDSDVADSLWTLSFLGDSGENRLKGTVSGDLFGLLQSVLNLGVGGAGHLDYIVSGGTGLFAGATGDGWSIFTFDENGFSQGGHLNVETSVPEPGLMALLLAGLGMVGFMAYRRRRLQSQI
jgi:hypothetical protein